MVEKFPYEDIVNLPPHISEKYPQPSMADRAARFAPFAAITGYEEMVLEEARITEKRIDLDEDTQRRLNEKQNFLNEHINELPEITVTHFVADKRKSGGSYITFTGKLRRVDEYERALIFEDKTAIAMDDIYDIQGNCFPSSND